MASDPILTFLNIGNLLIIYLTIFFIFMYFMGFDNQFTAQLFAIIFTIYLVSLTHSIIIIKPEDIYNYDI